MKSVLLGAGFAADLHARALRSCGIEIAAVVAQHENTAKDFAARYGIPMATTDFSVALAEDVDVVHVCTPPALHAEQILALLQRHKHVLCEKPLCLTSQEADALVSAAQHAGVVTALSYTVRFREACRRMQQLLRETQLGRPLLIHGHYLQEFHALPAPYDWRYDPALAGPFRAISEIGSHWLDLAQAISGERIIAVSAQAASFFPKRILREGTMLAAKETTSAEGDKTLTVSSEDAATVQLRFAGGAIGSVVLSEVSPGRGNALSLEITCESGNLWWDQEEAVTLHYAQKGKPIQTEQFAFGGGYADTFAALFRDFYAAAQSGSNPVSPAWATFADGAQIVRICEAIGESCQRDGVWISTEEGSTK